MRIEKLASLIVLIALAAFPLYGTEDKFSGTAPGEIRYEASMDWEKGLFTLSASVSLEAEGTMPLARNRGEKKIDDSMPSILKSALAGIRIDTYRFGRDIFYENPETLKRLEAVCTPEKKAHSSLSKDMLMLTSVYRFQAFPDLMSVFIEHEIPAPLSASLSWGPSSGKFSGILIYVTSGLPVYGESEKASLSPCLFPKLRDTRTGLVATPDMLPPEVLLSRGFATYASLENGIQAYPEAEIQKRVGVTPIKVLARGLFGTNRTDILIDDTSSRAILSREENLDLIRQGRILILFEDGQSGE